MADIEQKKFKTSDEDHVKLCRVFLQGLTKRGSHFAQFRTSWSDDLKGTETREGACHAGYGPGEGSILRATASGLFPSIEDKDMALRFWGWVSGEKSPWRLIFKNKEVELVSDQDGNPFGYIIYGKTVQEVPFSFLKNFAILCRSVSERSGQWRLWDYLVTKKNLNPSDAFYLISVFSSTSSNFDSGQLIPMELRSGGHWALTDGTQSQHMNKDRKSYPGPYTISVVSCFDWKAYKNGTPRFDIDHGHGLKINGCFCSENKEVPYDGNYVNRSSFKVSEIPFNKIGSKFSDTVYYNIDVVIDYFKKFLDQEGVLDVD